MKRFIKIYTIFFKQYLKGLMEYRVDFLIGMFAFFFSQGTGLLFLYVIFQNVTALAGFGIYEILLMYGLSLIPKGIDHLFFDNLWLLPRHVRQGGMDRYLLRPIQPLYSFLIERFQPDAFGEIILGSALVIVTTIELGIDVSIYHVLAVFSFIFIGIFIFTALKLMTSSTSFWLKNAYPLMQITYNMSDYTKYPLIIFPKAIQWIMTLIIPFALVSYYPALYLLNQMHYMVVMSYLVIVTSALILCALFVWKKGIKHYESAGS
ncbi:MAG: multidrug ABC transporter permease [Tenericutes bacterium HGW-Tenericutes-6]|nr:MAG: multidrug ABC transporter permease [Tenericutes bacterium HGW-Tenericutes-6]